MYANIFRTKTEKSATTTRTKLDFLLKAKLDETKETLSKFIAKATQINAMSMKKQYNSKQRKIKLMKIRKGMLDALMIPVEKKNVHPLILWSNGSQIGKM